MTPDERDRLARLEEGHEKLEEWVKDIHGDVKQLVAVANMGKGVLYAALKIGALVSLIIGAVWSVSTYLHGGGK